MKYMIFALLVTPVIHGQAVWLEPNQANSPPEPRWDRSFTHTAPLATYRKSKETVSASSTGAGLPSSVGESRLTSLDQPRQRG